MNSKHEKNKALAFLRLREMQSKIAAAKKAACLRQQEEAHQDWCQSIKAAEDHERARNEEVSEAMDSVCKKKLIKLEDLVENYDKFSWDTEQLKELQKSAADKADVHVKRVEATEEARLAHLKRESKIYQADILYKEATSNYFNEVLAIESEESDELSTNQYIFKSLKSSKS